MHPSHHNVEPPAPPRYDFTRFGRHRLRAPNAAIIDLPVCITAGARLWVATIWPDGHDGWGRQLWTLDPANQRGWQLPHQLAAGDVVEFGADTPDGPMRWYGIMDSYEVDRWATMQGPYPHPATAWNEAQRLLALERFLEPLDTLPAEEPDPTEQRHRSRPERQHSRRHRHHHHRRGGTSPI